MNKTFKKGDVVRIRTDLAEAVETGSFEDYEAVVRGMLKYAGTGQKICFVGKDGYAKLLHDCEGFWWPIGAFEPAPEYDNEGKGSIMKHKYKVGKKVKVRSTLTCGEEHSTGLQVTPSMGTMSGKIIKITDAWYAPDGSSRYNVKGSNWSWDDECFEPVKKKKKCKAPTVVLDYGGGNFFTYDEWFDQDTTPGYLRAYKGHYKRGHTVPLGKKLLILGCAAHARGPERYPQGVALLQDRDTAQVYLYDPTAFEKSELDARNV